jgi:hypothetical protein
VEAATAPQPWTEEELAEAIRPELDDLATDVTEDFFMTVAESIARVALSRPLAGEVVLDYAAAVSALVLVLPLAKGYAAAHPVGANQRFCDVAQDVIERYDAAIGEGKP